LRKLIQFILNKTRQMGAHYSSFMGGGLGSVVPNDRVLAQGSTKRDDLGSKSVE
jgi:hypothetical protein